MKLKIILTVIPSIVLLNLGLAQSKTVRAALRGGTYFSRFKFSGISSSDGKPKGDDFLYGGIQIDIPVSTNFSLVTEVLYAASSVQYYDKIARNLYHDEMSHLLVPFLIKYKPGKFGLFVGPQMDMLLTAKNFNTDIKNNSYKKFGFSGVAGFEFVFKYRFGIDARYQSYFGDFRASNGSTAITTRYGKIQMHAFQTGLFFRFGKKPIKQKE